MSRAPSRTRLAAGAAAAAAAARRAPNRATLGRRGALATLAALGALAGCPAGDIGVLQLELATAPGSTVMDGVEQLRLTFQSPRQQFTVDRTERGFDLVLDLEAAGGASPLVIEGFDASGGLVAAGMSPPFALASVNARVVVYMAPPLSVGAAPAALAPARSRISLDSLSYGAVLAGGADAQGVALDPLQIYNAYDHTLRSGLPLLAPRAGVTLGRAANNAVLLFGGTDAAGAATGTLWGFDTTAAPSGRYVSLGDFPQFARTGATAVPISSDSYLISGAPAIQVSAAGATDRSQLAPFASGASTLGSDNIVSTVLVAEGTGDLAFLRGGTQQAVIGQKPGGTAVALVDRRIAVLGGTTAPGDALLIDPQTGAASTAAGALTGAYDRITVAATRRFVVVAGLSAAAPGETTIEILDAATLAPRQTVTVTDELTAAVALTNEQVLLAGSTLQLFTPPPP